MGGRRVRDATLPQRRVVARGGAPVRRGARPAALGHRRGREGPLRVRGPAARGSPQRRAARAPRRRRAGVDPRGPEAAAVVGPGGEERRIRAFGVGVFRARASGGLLRRRGPARRRRPARGRVRRLGGRRPRGHVGAISIRRGFRRVRAVARLAHGRAIEAMEAGRLNPAPGAARGAVARPRRPENGRPRAPRRDRRRHGAARGRQVPPARPHAPPIGLRGALPGGGRAFGLRGGSRNARRRRRGTSSRASGGRVGETAGL
mmetsp:Transcript_3494/g.10810  ORF Transcript_3494/g.10810 Transcript_3494/m.10810 type:complete len:261 (+) Transcript_3494:2081-2863(+)